MEIIEDKNKKVTIPKLTKYERAHILGVRASQLNGGAPPFVDIEDETDSLKIARKELEERKIPFIVRRKFPDGSFEDWPLNELEL